MKVLTVCTEVYDNGGLKVIHPTLCIQSPSQKKTVAMRWIVDTTCNRYYQKQQFYLYLF